MIHKHRIGLPVILLDTGQVGTVDAQLEPQAGIAHYRIDVAGRPAIPGRAQGAGSIRDLDEVLIGVGMTVGEKIAADAQVADGVRAWSAGSSPEIRNATGIAKRDAQLSHQESIRDAAGSTDQEINEAIRLLAAIVLVNAEQEKGQWATATTS